MIKNGLNMEKIDLEVMKRSFFSKMFEAGTGPRDKFEAKFLRPTQVRRANLRLTF